MYVVDPSQTKDNYNLPNIFFFKVKVIFVTQLKGGRSFGEDNGYIFFFIYIT